MDTSQKLVEEIRRLAEEDGKVKKELQELDDDIWDVREGYDNLKQLWRGSRWKKLKDFSCAQLARQIFDPREEEKMFMYARLHSLLRQHDQVDRYFDILSQDGHVYSLKHPLAEVDRLDTLYEEFIQFFADIKNRIDFDFPEEEYSGPSIRGKINWQKTILKSKTKFPLQFYSKTQERKYETPENILLILCVEWMYRDAIGIYELMHDEPLDDLQTSKLNGIIDKARNILLTFPYATVLNTSKRLWNENYRENSEILQLEKTVKERLDGGNIKNKKYYNLLEWIKKYKELYLENINDTKITSRPITALEAQDYLFEAWIFFEFIDFIEKKGYKCHLTFGKKIRSTKEATRFFTFNIDGVDVKFQYEAGHKSWIGSREMYPDFTVKINEKIIYILDAKNYARNVEGKDPINADIARQLAFYLMSYNCDRGAFIFPYAPEENYFKTFPNPGGAQKVDCLRMTPNWKSTTGKIRNQTFEFIFKQISKHAISISRSINFKPKAFPG